jgi:hypothetical protein
MVFDGAFDCIFLSYRHQSIVFDGALCNVRVLSSKACGSTRKPIQYVLPDAVDGQLTSEMWQALAGHVYRSSQNFYHQDNACVYIAPT